MLERRKAVRIPAKLAMEVRISGSECARAESINVSANGVYFLSDAYIPVLTKLQIALQLPAAEVDAEARGIREVVCEGVVVRSEPEEEEKGRSRYEIACYFTSVADKDKEYLESYILKQVVL